MIFPCLARSMIRIILQSKIFARIKQFFFFFNRQYILFPSASDEIHRWFMFMGIHNSKKIHIYIYKSYSWLFYMIAFKMNHLFQKSGLKFCCFLTIWGRRNENKVNKIRIKLKDGLEIFCLFCLLHILESSAFINKLNE